MIVKIQIGNATKQDYVYIYGNDDKYGNKSLLYFDIASYAMMFRTSCIAFKNTQINKYHFVNWINKHTDLCAYITLPVSGRIDL